MKLELKICQSMCDLDVFNINGGVAQVDDFGYLRDDSPERADDYGCGDRRFYAYEESLNLDVLEKYKITSLEYREICQKLEKGLSFGHCGLCI